MSDREEIILIGTPRVPAVDDAAELLLDALIMALQDFDTDALLAIAALRDKMRPDGWMQTMIREYVETWRS